MSTQPPLSPSPDPPPAVVLFPVSPSPSEAPAANVEATAAASGGARRLSRWEQQEAEWFPEERDLTHSGINE